MDEEQYLKMEYYNDTFNSNQTYRNLTNYEDLFNVDWDLKEKYENNRAVSDIAYYSLITAYSVVIFFGTIGNLFVITAIISNKGKSYTETSTYK